MFPEVETQCPNHGLPRKSQLLSCQFKTQFNHSAFLISSPHDWASLVAQLAKNLPAVQETLVRFLGWEDTLEIG